MLVNCSRGKKKSYKRKSTIHVQQLKQSVEFIIINIYCDVLQ
jgi:hypothetical protein